MSHNSIQLEEERLQAISNLEEYDMLHERHRIFPQIFENRKHKKIIDISAGVGVVGKRIKEGYAAAIVCNDISPKCLSILQKNNLDTVSFNLDTDTPFPLPDKSFDAVISLATIEHIFNIDHFAGELQRILTDDGYLYISAPNYNGLLCILRLLITGKTFHDPLDKKSAYEFYAHIRYFTYRTLKEYLGKFGFVLHTVYLPIPKASTRYLNLKKKSPFLALAFKFSMTLLYTFFSPRWAAEPVLCLKKTAATDKPKPRKRVL